MFSKVSLRYEPIPLPDRSNLTDREMAQAAGAFYNNIRRRHTVRSYSDRAVPREIIEDCVKSAGTAPSGANHQPWHFVAIANPEAKHRIR